MSAASESDAELAAIEADLAEVDAELAALDEDAPTGPAAELRRAVEESFGTEAAQLPAILLAMNGATAGVAALAWRAGLFTGWQATWRGGLGMVAVTLSSAVIAALCEGLLPAIGAWRAAAVLIAGGLGALAHAIGLPVPQAAAVFGAMLTGYGLLEIGFARWNRRDLKALGVSEPLARAIVELPEALLDNAELSGAVQAFVDVREALAGPLAGEPGIAADAILADAAAVLAAVVRRAPAVDRLLERSIDDNEVEQGAWSRADAEWTALIEELHGTAEALLTFAARHDAGSREALGAHLQHLHRLRDAQDELERALGSTPGAP